MGAIFLEWLDHDHTEYRLFLPLASIAIAKSSKNQPRSQRERTAKMEKTLLPTCRCGLFGETAAHPRGGCQGGGATAFTIKNDNFQLNRLANIFHKVRTPYVMDCCVPGKPNQISGLHPPPSPSRLMLWDTAGQEEFDEITKAYYR